jgi:hypothetical protein
MTDEQIEREAEEFVDLTIKYFKMLDNAWPFHRLHQIDKFGQTRYCLTCKEKEQLKSLGLQNLFNTSWLKPSPRISQMEK